MSETGAGFTVRSISRPAVGQALCVVFELTDGYEWVVDDQAVVARCDPRPDGMYDVGVRLTDLELYPAEDLPAQPHRLLV